MYWFPTTNLPEWCLCRCRRSGLMITCVRRRHAATDRSNHFHWVGRLKYRYRKCWVFLLYFRDNHFRRQLLHRCLVLATPTPRLTAKTSDCKSFQLSLWFLFSETGSFTLVGFFFFFSANSGIAEQQFWQAVRLCVFSPGLASTKWRQMWWRSRQSWTRYGPRWRLLSLPFVKKWLLI